MNTTAGTVTGLQAFLASSTRRLYRQGVGTVPMQAIRPAFQSARSEARPELLEELVASIRSTGVIQPIIVRPISGFPHQFEVVAGQRRFSAAQLAGLINIPAIIRDFNDQEALAISLIENVQREELSSADEARAIKRLVDEFSLTHEQIARTIGRSRAAVSNLLRLLELPDEVTSLMESRAISMGHARALLALEEDSERVRVAQLVAARRMSVRETEVQVRQAAPLRTRRLGAVTPQLSVTEEAVNTRGVRVEVHQRADGTGRIVIEFDDPQARDVILERLRESSEHLR